MAFLSGGDDDCDTVNLQFTGLLSSVTSQILETYIATKAEYHQDEEVQIVKVMMQDKGSAVVIVKGLQDVDEFINRKHTIKRSKVVIAVTDLPVEEEEDEEEAEDGGQQKNPHDMVIPDLIEVTGADGIDMEVLEMYFEGRKSGGRREKEVESIQDVGNGVIHIKFSEEEDAAAVVNQQRHVMKKKHLTVRYVPAPVPKEYEKDKLIVRNIPDDVDEDMFTMFVEQRLKIDEGEGVSIDYRDTCALLLFDEQYTDDDLEKMAFNLSSKKLRKKYTLSVERCEVNSSVLVSNITNKTFASEDGLEMYFESSRAGGGEDLIETVEMLGPDRAKITFKESYVVTRVLSRNHQKKLGQQVCVTACTPLDSFETEDIKHTDSQEETEDEADSDEEETRGKRVSNETPKNKKKKVKQVEEESIHACTLLHPPVVHPLDPLIAKCLKHSVDVLQALSQEVQVTLSIDESKSSITLTQNEYSSQDWPSTATEKLSFSLSEMICREDIPVPSEAASNVYPMIMRYCNQEGLQYAFGQGDNKVCVAGKTQLVNKLRNEVEELCSRMIRKAEVINVSEEDYAFLKEIQFTVIQSQNRGMQFKCVDLDHSLSVNGSLRDIADFKGKISSYLAHIRIPVNLHPLAVGFLKASKGAQILQKIVQDTKCVPFFALNSEDETSKLFVLCTQDDAREAEHLATKISTETQVKSIDLSQYFLLHVAKGHRFSSHKESMNKRYPHVSSLEHNKLLLVASSEILPLLFEAYEAFIAEECSKTEVVTFKKGVWRFFNSTWMDRKWQQLVEELKAIGVSIVQSSKTSANKPFIKIKGEPDKLERAKEKISSCKDSLVEHQIPIARPGVCQYFLSNASGQMNLKGIENDAQVCIEMGVKDENMDDTGNEQTKPYASPDFTKVCFGSTDEMKTVSIFVGDITEFNRAEVIVNAANEYLKHGGGVAQDILLKGGSVIATDSEKYIQKKGPVNAGSAVLFTQAGSLPPPYKAIVHAVGPKWHNRDEREKALLKRAVYTGLEKAANYNSIAIPAISGGIFGFPNDVCADVVMQAITMFSQHYPSSLLRDINLVIFQDNVDVFVSAAKKHIQNVHNYNEASSTPKATNSQDSQGNTRRRRRVAGKSTAPGIASTFNSPPSLPDNDIQHSRKFKSGNDSPGVSYHPNITITQGDILKNQEDILVNPTDQKLSFGGYVAKAILKEAGPGLPEECEGIQTPIPIGDVVITGAHCLSSKFIAHVVVPSHDGTPSETILRNILVKCLEECDRLGVKSISVPSIGAGNLRYPADVCAKCLLEEAASYLSRNQGKTSLQLVRFVIFDPKVHQSFLAEYQSGKSRGACTTTTHRSGSSENTPYNRGYSSSHGEADKPCIFSLPGNLQLEVVQGDITDESVDVVVNTTVHNLKLQGSGVAGALAKRGGRKLQNACDSLVARGIYATEGKVAETICQGMGQLKCKSIFHICFSGKNQKMLTTTILACLERAEQMQYHSIAFPAIGTGTVQYPSDKAVDAFVKALRQITSKKPRYLKAIRMVLYQPKHYEQFSSAFKRLGESSGGFLNYMYDKVIKPVGSFFGYSGHEGEGEVLGTESLGVEHHIGEEEEFEDIGEEERVKNMLAHLSKESEVIVFIYGGSNTSVQRAEKRLRAIIDTQFVTEEVDDPSISSLSFFTVEELMKYASSHQVDIDVDRDPVLHFIKIHGCHGDVLRVKDKVREVLARFTQERVKKEAAEAMSKHIRWMREVNEELDEYDGVFSFEIEQAFQRKEKKYRSSDPAEMFEIDFTLMKETDLENKEVVNVIRQDLLQEEKPTNWDPMPTDSAGKEMHVHQVTLQPTSPEYKEVEDRFNTTLKKGSHYKDIISIQRIQNPILYGQFVSRKREMDKRNPAGHKNERWLFHGTAPGVLNDITTQGFNRSFQGKNAVVYGQGAYFARDAAYSNRDTYSVPDGNGDKYMYVARVLTGEYTVGNSSMVVPPAKNPQLNKHVLFDSTVDNQASPSIFVVYGDSQCYPAYLIKYKRN